MKLHLDHRRICAGGNDKVEFQFAEVSVENNVDTGICVLIADFGIVRYTGSPLSRIVPYEEATAGGRQVYTFNSWSRISATQSHANLTVLGDVGSKNHFVRGQQNRIGAAPRKILDLGIGLSS